MQKKLCKKYLTAYFRVCRYFYCSFFHGFSLKKYLRASFYLCRYFYIFHIKATKINIKKQLMLTTVGGNPKTTLLYLPYGGENNDWRKYFIPKKNS